MSIENHKDKGSDPKREQPAPMPQPRKVRVGLRHDKKDEPLDWEIDSELEKWAVRPRDVLAAELRIIERAQERSFVRRACEDDDDFKVKEVRFKSLSNVSASFDGKTCTWGLYYANFDGITSIITLIRHNLLYSLFSIFFKFPCGGFHG